MAVIAGKVAPRFMGAYNSSTTYQFYDAVTYGNKLYFCKTSGTVGKTPSGATDNYWFLSIDGTFTDASSLGGETATQWQTKIDKVASKAWNYSIGTTGKYYRVFARMDGTKNNEPETLLISGGGNFANIDGLWAVSFFERPNSTRSFIVRELIPSKAGNVKFGWYTEGSYRYFGMYTGNDYSSVPFITKLDGNSSSGVFHAEYGAFYLNATMPTGWEEVTVEKFATNIDLANYLPKSGGEQYQAGYLFNYLKTDKRNILWGIDGNGALVFVDQTNGGNQIIVSGLNGTNTFKGTATGNLPLTGGTITADYQPYITFTATGAPNTYGKVQKYGDGMRIGLYNTDGSASNEVVLGNNIQDEKTLLRMLLNDSSFRVVLHSGNYTDYALPKSGGTATGLTIAGGDGQAYITYSTGSTRIGHLGFIGANNPVLIKNDDATVCSLLHTGNSAKVVQAASAPSDTTSVWIDTANKKTKAYIDGAWTALA